MRNFLATIKFLVWLEAFNEKVYAEMHKEKNG